MTADRDFDRRLGSWLDETSHPGRPRRAARAKHRARGCHAPAPRLARQGPARRTHAAALLDDEPARRGRRHRRARDRQHAPRARPRPIQDRRPGPDARCQRESRRAVPDAVAWTQPDAHGATRRATDPHVHRACRRSRPGGRGLRCQRHFPSRSRAVRPRDRQGQSDWLACDCSRPAHGDPAPGRTRPDRRGRPCELGRRGLVPRLGRAVRPEHGHVQPDRLDDDDPRGPHRDPPLRRPCADLRGQRRRRPRRRLGRAVRPRDGHVQPHRVDEDRPRLPHRHVARRRPRPDRRGRPRRLDERWPVPRLGRAVRPEDRHVQRDRLHGDRSRLPRRHPACRRTCPGHRRHHRQRGDQPRLGRAVRPEDGHASPRPAR